MARISLRSPQLLARSASRTGVAQWVTRPRDSASSNWTVVEPAVLGDADAFDHLVGVGDVGRGVDQPQDIDAADGGIRDHEPL